MAGEFKHQDLNNGVTPDDPGAFLTPTKWDKALRLSGGTNGQIVVRATAEALTGMTLTSTPAVSALVFPLNTDPSTLPIGGWTVTDDGMTVKLYVKRLDGSLVTFEVG